MKHFAAIVTGCQLLALLLAGSASASVTNRTNLRRSPASVTLAECLAKQGLATGTKVPIQALRACMGQVQKREETETEDAEEEPDSDVTSYIIDGGKPNVPVG